MRMIKIRHTVIRDAHSRKEVMLVEDHKSKLRTTLIILMFLATKDLLSCIKEDLMQQLGPLNTLTHVACCLSRQHDRQFLIWSMASH